MFDLMVTGPIIRIQPNELHVADLEAYHQIFRVGTPFDKVWHNATIFDGSIQSMETLPEAKKRKEFFSTFFSKSAIRKLEPYQLRPKLDQFLTTLGETNGKVVDFYLAFRCLTADTIMDYCFHRDLGAIKEPAFESPVVMAMIEGFGQLVIGTFFPNSFELLNKVIMSLPEESKKKYFAPVYGMQLMMKASQELLLPSTDYALTRLFSLLAKGFSTCAQTRIKLIPRFRLCLMPCSIQMCRKDR